MIRLFRFRDITGEYRNAGDTEIPCFILQPFLIFAIAHYQIHEIGYSLSQLWQYLQHLVKTFVEIVLRIEPSCRHEDYLALDFITLYQVVFAFTNSILGFVNTIWKVVIIFMGNPRPLDKTPCC